MAYNQPPFIEANPMIKAHVVSDNVGWIILENTIAKANKYYLICVRENL